MEADESQICTALTEVHLGVVVFSPHSTCDLPKNNLHLSSGDHWQLECAPQESPRNAYHEANPKEHFTKILKEFNKKSKWGDKIGTKQSYKITPNNAKRTTERNKIDTCYRTNKCLLCLMCLTLTLYLIKKHASTKENVFKTKRQPK